MPTSPIVRVSRRLPAVVEQTLRERWGAELSPDDRPLGEGGLDAALDSCDVLLCTLGDVLSADLLERRARRTRLLANFGVGVNHIDVAAATRAGIAVTNTPGVLTDDTADLTMLLVLAAMRRAREGSDELQRGEWTGWRPTHLLGTRVTGATLGIVGFGRIGQAVARRAHHGFGMRIVYHSRTEAPPEVVQSLGARRASLHELLAQSHVVTLHCPATPATRHLIDARAIAAMRPDAFLVNTARGDVVDEGALERALQQGTIAGAGLDVFDDEPRVDPALLALPNVFALPHVGSATVAGRTAMGMRAVENIAAFVEGRPLPDPVR